MAPVQGYRVLPRLALIPDEPDHPRAGDPYFKVLIGPLRPLANAIPSRRLRRITFISTTLSRLLEAQEINDLWVKTSMQETLWQAWHTIEKPPCGGLSSVSQTGFEPVASSSAGKRSIH